MLQGLLSPNMERLSAMENNLPASHVWNFPNQADSNYQAAAMEAILSQASLGLISEHQALVNYGILNHPSIAEGMDETQFLPPSSVCVNTDISSSSATTSCSLGFDHKPSPTAFPKLPSRASHMMLSQLPHDVSTGQAAIFAVSAASKKRSWHEALSSPPPADQCSRGVAEFTERQLSPPAPTILYPVNDPKVAIASLAYPCKIVEAKSETHEYTPYIDHRSMGMVTRIDPLNTVRVNHMQESLNSGAAGILRADDHGAGMEDTINRNVMPLGRCAKWKEGVTASDSQGKLSTAAGHYEMIKDALSTHESVHLSRSSNLYKGFLCDDQSGPSNSLYAGKLAVHVDSNEKIGGISLSSSPAIQFASHPSRKRPAAIAELPSSSASYSKRAHLQNRGLVNMGACSTTTTTSTTTRSSKSSSRNPQGRALNTNGRPRAMQGSANDPQSVAARNRRERINARLKVLQELVPNGSKVDLVTMLEKAINYVKFLQLQLRVLSNDDYWQASQENGEQATTRSEEGYSAHINAACDSTIACSDNVGDKKYSYMCDKLYNT